MSSLKEAGTSVPAHKGRRPGALESVWQLGFLRRRELQFTLRNEGLPRKPCAMTRASAPEVLAHELSHRLFRP